MKKQINEIKRMQQLAGILKETQEIPGTEEVQDKPGYDELIAYLENHPEDVKKLKQAAEKMKQDGLKEAIDKNKVVKYLIDVGMGTALGALVGSILGGVADPAHVLNAIAAGVGYVGGATALVSLPAGGFKK